MLFYILLYLVSKYVGSRRYESKKLKSELFIIITVEKAFISESNPISITAIKTVELSQAIVIETTENYMNDETKILPQNDKLEPVKSKSKSVTVGTTDTVIDNFNRATSSRNVRTEERVHRRRLDIDVIKNIQSHSNIKYTVITNSPVRRHGLLPRGMRLSIFTMIKHFLCMHDKPSLKLFEIWKRISIEKKYFRRMDCIQSIP